MAKIEITKTELVWPGNEDGALKDTPRVNYPSDLASFPGRVGVTGKKCAPHIMTRRAGGS